MRVRGLNAWLHFWFMVWFMVWFTAWLFGLLSGCGNDNSYEDYGMTSEADLTLTSQTHPHGWQKSQCFACHLERRIHQVDRIKSPLTAVGRDLTRSQGLASCRGCHGDNGGDGPR